MKVKNITLVITDPCYIEHTVGSKFIEESTIYGDWSCMCYRGDELFAREKAKEWDEIYFEFFRKYNSIDNSTELNKAEKKKINEEFIAAKNKFIEENCYGEFCADSGMVAVFDYNKLHEKDKMFVDEHPWCACIIPNYTGEFDYIIDEHNNAHIVGEIFYTMQSGL